MRKLDLELLKCFVVFAESENITEAAKKLGISQPSVSVHLTKLEETLPYSPFSISGKRKLLNSYGKALYEAIKGPIDEVYRKVERVNLKHSSTDYLNLRLAGKREVLQRIVPRLNFLGQFQVFDLHGEKAIEKLVKLEIDIAITKFTTSEFDIFSTKLYSDRAKFITHKKWMDKSKDFVEQINTQGFLENTPCLIYSDIERPFITQWCNHLDFDYEKLNIKCEYQDWDTIVELVSSGLGFSIVPTSFEVTSKNVVEYEIPSKIIAEMSFYALYHKDLKEMNVIKKIFQDFLK